MSRVALNKKVPAFSAVSDSEEKVKLSDFKGQNLVVYFYPKDNTSGCTQEGLDFNANLGKFKRCNTAIVGVSRDSVTSHQNFVAKQGFKFPLLADEDESLCQLFDVIHEKNMYGRKVLGVVRSTFLIDAKGVLRREWRGVKVPGHVDEVLEAAKELA